LPPDNVASNDFKSASVPRTKQNYSNLAVYDHMPMSLPYEICEDNIGYRGVLNILDAAEDILDDVVMNADLSLEPTPIDPQGIQILVSEVSLFESMGRLLHNKSVDADELLDTLNPLITAGRSLIADSCASKRGLRTSLPAHKRRRVSVEPNSAKFLSNTSIKLIENQNQDQDIEVERFRPYQFDQWKDRFQDLVAFREKNGHCLVPHNFPENQQLAQWIKRQRYQYKLKQMHRHSTLTDERQITLESMGFVWDSHRAAWIERFEALKEFRAKHGHCSVASNYVDRSLAIWVKCQRRQYKLYQQGSRSTMTEERFAQLDEMGFCWNPRNLK